MADKQERKVIDDLRKGRNGYDAPWAIADDECADAVNVDFYKSRLGNKRGGMSDPGLTNSPFTGILSSLFRHVPSVDETQAELWGVDSTRTIGRLAGGTAWSTPTVVDGLASASWTVTAASINSLLVLAYDSGLPRLHLWDGSTVRRAGLAAPAAPVVSNTGSGSYVAALRYYRIRFLEKVGSDIRRSSEPGTYTSFTPNASALAARVERPALIGEGETHWVVEASTDSITFYQIATHPITTTEHDDSAATSSYSSNVNTLSPLTGTFTLPKSYKFVAADQGRLLGFGSWTQTDKQNDIEVSAVIGSRDEGDAERIDTTINYRIGLDENDSGVPTGLKGPVLGSFMAFKNRQAWLLTPTGQTSQPYRQDNISKSIGAVGNNAIDIGDDKRGNSAAYWTSHRGFYRWSVDGLKYIGQGMEDYVLGPTETINLAANVVAVTRYHADKRQVWCWWATGDSLFPNQCAFFDVQTEGWTRIPSSDLLANIRCAVMFSNTIGAAMSRDLKPYVGQSQGENRIWKADTGTDDVGTPFQAYVITKAFEPGGPGFYGEVGDAELLAKASTGVTITDTVTRDFGAETKTGTADLTPTADEGAATRVSRRLEDSAFGGCRFVQHQLGDAEPVSNRWTLDRLIVPFVKTEAASA
jgi:hypothetical protein